MTEIQLTVAYGLLTFITLGVANAAIFALFKKKKLDKKYYNEPTCRDTCEQCSFKCQKDDAKAKGNSPKSL